MAQPLKLWFALATLIAMLVVAGVSARVGPPPFGPSTFARDGERESNRSASLSFASLDSSRDKRDRQGIPRLRSGREQRAAEHSAPAQDPQIRVEVNLVSVLASVLDKDGKPVPDLPGEAFEIYEEGVKQKVELFEAETSLPLDLALMIDASLSTFKELSFEREAAAHFIRQVVRPGDALAVYQFSDVVERLADYSSDVPRLQTAARSVQVGTGTAMYDAIYLGAQSLARRPANRRRVIVLVTDAGETTSRASFETARSTALHAAVLLYTILVRPVKTEGGRNTAGEHALVHITDVTGGAMYYPADVTEFDAVFDRIDRELRTQYRLGYYPNPRPPARSYRRIEVRVRPSPVSAGTGAVSAAADSPQEVLVRHRKGYFTAGAIE